MKWMAFMFAIVVGAAVLPGCEKGQAEGLSPEHQALIAEFKGFETEQCACKDYDCTKAVGQKVGPRVQAVMADVGKLPKEVQVKLGAVLTHMTECAQATRKP